MQRFRKIMYRGAIVVCVSIVVIVVWCIAWEWSPGWRTASTLESCGFASLPASAQSVSHQYSGPYCLVGFLKYGLGSVTINISFKAESEDIATFIRHSPVINEPRTRKTADGSEGEIDAMTSWRLRINVQENRIQLTIRDHFD